MERIIDGKKKCTKCLEVKTVDCFGLNKRVKSGLSSTCRACNNKVAILFRKQNEAHFKSYIKNYAEKNRESMNAYHRRYYRSKTPSFGQPVVMLRNEKGQYSKKIDTVII